MKGILPEQIESLRFSYESHLFGEIRRRLGAIPLMDFNASGRLLECRKRDLLGDAVRITADLLPEVHDIYQSYPHPFQGHGTGRT